MRSLATGGAQNPADFVVGTRDVKELLLPLGRDGSLSREIGSMPCGSANSLQGVFAYLLPCQLRFYTVSCYFTLKAPRRQTAAQQ